MLYYFTMVNSVKNFLTKKNHLTCDHTMRRSTNHINIQFHNEMYIEHIYLII